jgi:uncharacterized protein (UPF0335 family)
MTLRSDAVDNLKSYLERIERIEEERGELGDDIRALYAQAKAEGFAPKAIRAMVKRRRAKDPQKLDEDETILETYMHAVGMLPENPLAAAVSRLAVDVLARDQVLEALQQMVPRNGEIIARVGGEPVRIWRDDEGQAHVEPYVEPKAPQPAEKTGKGLKKSATVLTMVPASVTAAADAAEARSKIKKPADEPASDDVDTDEPVR